MLTVKQLLDIGELKDLRLVAGEQGADNMIKNAITMDNPEMVHWMRNGELLLTTGYNISEDETKQKQLITELFNIGCPGLGIKIKRYYPKIPKAIILESQKIGLPIIEIPYHYALSDIVKNVNRHILGNRIDSYEQQELFLSMIMQTISKGGSLKGILTITESFISYPTFITDTQQNITDYSPSCSLYNDNIREAIAGKRNNLNEDASGQAKFYICGGSKELEMFLVKVSNTAMEKLFLIKNKDELLPDSKRQIVNTLVTYLGNYFIIRNESVLQSIKSIDDFLFILLKNDNMSFNKIKYCANKFNIDVEKKYVCAILHIVSDDNYEDFNQRFKDIKVMLKKEMSRSCYIVYNGNYSDLVFVCELNNDDNINNVNNYISDIFYSKISRYINADWDCYMCNGNICDNLSLIWKSYNEATLTLQIIKRDGNKVGHYTDYIIHNMLINFQEGREYLENIIKPLKLHDEETNDELIKTLKEYFNSFGNITKAAEKLFIHRNTLGYRIKKAKEILGYDLDYNKMLEICLAFKVLDLE